MSASRGTAAGESAAVPAIGQDDRVPPAAWVIAAAYVALELAVSDRYGFQRDASCRQLAVCNPPGHVNNDWNDLAIGVCTGPSGSWKALWPHMRHYD